MSDRSGGRHLDWLLDYIRGKDPVFDWIRSLGGTADVSCYWLSASGHGGPALRPEQMGTLASLGLEIWFDVYWADCDSTNTDA